MRDPPEIYGSLCDWREIKKFENHYYSATYWAWLKGNEDALSERKKRNHYPRGKRHTEYERGYELGRLESLEGER